MTQINTLEKAKVLKSILEKYFSIIVGKTPQNYDMHVAGHLTYLRFCKDKLHIVESPELSYEARLSAISFKIFLPVSKRKAPSFTWGM